MFKTVIQILLYSRCDKITFHFFYFTALTMQCSKTKQNKKSNKARGSKRQLIDPVLMKQSEKG